MSSFVEHGTRLFENCRYQRRKLVRKRSHGRLKAYSSCDDIRAWSSNTKDQRKHIRDVVTNVDHGFGNYIPVPELVKVSDNPATKELLHLAISKLEAINKMVPSDTQIVTEPTTRENSESCMSDACPQCTAAARHYTEEEVKNLRCLVQELAEQKYYFEEQYKEALQVAKCQSDMSIKLEELQTERDCLSRSYRRAKDKGLKAEYINEIEDKLQKTVEGFRDTKRQLRELEWRHAKCQKLEWELTEAKIRAHDKEFWHDEYQKQRCDLEKLRFAATQSEMFEKETKELQCVIADQDDEIRGLLNRIQQMEENSLQTQERLRKALSDTATRVGEREEELLAAQEELYSKTKLVNELEEVKEEMQRNIAILMEDKEYFQNVVGSLSDSESKLAVKLKEKEDEIERLSELQKLDKLVEVESQKASPVDNCEEAMALTKETLTKVLKDYKASKREIKRLENDNEKLKEDLKESECKISGAIDEVERFAYLLKETEGKLFTERAVNRELKEDLKDAKVTLESLNELERNYNRLKNQLDKEKEGVLRRNREILKARDERKELEDQNQIFSNLLKTSEAKNGDLQGRNDQLEKDRELMKEQERKLRAQLEQLENAVTDNREMTKMMIEGKKLVAGLEGQLEIAKAREKDNQTELRDLNMKFDDMKGLSDILQKKLEKEEKARVTQTEALLGENELLKNDLSVAKEKAALSELDMKREMYEKLGLMDDLENLKDHIHSLRDSLADVGSEKAKLEGEINCMKQKLFAAEMEAERRTGKTAECEEKLKVLKEDKKELKKNIEDLRKQLHDAQCEITAKKAQKEEICALSNIIDDLNDQKGCLEKEFKLQMEEDKSLKQKVSSLEDKKIPELMDIINQLNKKYSKSLGLRDVGETIVADLKVTLKQLQKEKSEVDCLLENERKKGKKLKNELSEMENDFKALQEVNSKNLEKIVTQGEENASFKKQMDGLQLELEKNRHFARSLEDDLRGLELENSALKGDVNGLRQEITDLDNIRKDLDSSLEGMVKDKNAEKRKVKELKAEREAQLNAQRKLEESLAGALYANVKLKDDIELQNKLLEEKDQLSAGLEGQLDSEKISNQNLLDERAEVKKELRKSMEANREVRKELNLNRLEAERLSNMVTNLENELRGLSQMKESLQSELQDLLEDQTVAKELMSTTKKNLEEARSEKEAQKEKLDILTAEKRCLIDDIHKAKKRIKDLEKLEEETSLLSIENGLLKHDLEKLKDAFEETKRIAAETLSDLARKLDKEEKLCRLLKKENGSLNDMVTKLEDDVGNFSQVIEKQKREIEKFKGDTEKLQLHEDSISGLENRVEGLKGEISISKQMIIDAQLDSASWKAQLDLANKLKEEADGKTHELEKVILGLEKDLAIAGNKVATFEMEKNSCKKEIGHLQGQITSLEEEIKGLIDKLELEHLAKTQGQAEAIILMAEISDLKKIVDDKDMDIWTFKREKEGLMGEIDRLKQEGRGINMVSSSLECDLDNSRQDNKKLQALTDRLNDQLKSTKRESEKLGKEKLEKEEKIENLAARIKSLKEEINGLKGERDSVLDRLMDNKKDLMILRNDLKKLENERDSLFKEVGELKVRVKKDKEENKTLNDSIKDLKEKVEGTNEDIGELTDTKQKLEFETGRLIKSCKDLERRLGEEQEMAGIIAKDLQGNKKLNADMKEKLEETIKKNKEALGELDKFKEENERMFKENFRLEQELVTAKHMGGKKEVAMNALKVENAALNNNVLNLEKQLDDLNGQIKRLQEQMDGVRNRNVNLESQLAGTKNSVVDLECKARELQEKNKAYLGEIELALVSLADRTRERDNMKCRLEEEREEASDLKEGMFKLQQNVTYLVGAREEDAKKLDCLKGENTAMKQEIERAKHDARILECLKSRLEADLNKAKMNLEKARDDVRMLKGDLQGVADKKAALEKEMEKKNKEAGSLTDSLKLAKERFNSEASLRKDLERTLEKSKDELATLRDVVAKMKFTIEKLKGKVKELDYLAKEEKEAKERYLRDVNDLRKIVKKNSEAMALCDALKSNLEKEIVVLRNSVETLTTIIRTIKAMEPPDTKLNRILRKIMLTGWSTCELDELAELHQGVTLATDRLVCKCTHCKQELFPCKIVGPLTPCQKTYLQWKKKALEDQIAKKLSEVENKSCHKYMQLKAKFENAECSQGRLNDKADTSCYCSQDSSDEEEVTCQCQVCVPQQAVQPAVESTTKRKSSTPESERKTKTQAPKKLR